MFKREFFVVTFSKTIRNGYEEKCKLSSTHMPNVWLFAPTFGSHEFGSYGDSLGDVMVYELKEAAERQYKYNVSNRCQIECWNTTMQFVRAYTKSGAAKLAFARGGEVVAFYYHSIPEINDENQAL